MIKLRKTIRLAACAVLCLPYVANAATVAKQTGDVLVSKGDGFAPMTRDTELAPGSQVMVRPGGLAMITYSTNCLVRVGSGVWVVQPAAPCADGAREIDLTGRMNQQTEPDGKPGINGTTLLIGGVVVAGGVAAIILLTHKHKKDKSASP